MIRKMKTNPFINLWPCLYMMQFKIFEDIIMRKKNSFPVPEVAYLALTRKSPNSVFGATQDRRDFICFEIRLNHKIPKNFFILYRFLSLGLVFELRKRLKKLTEQSIKIAAFSRRMSFSLRNCLNFCLNSSMSIALRYITINLSCQVFFCYFL